MSLLKVNEVQNYNGSSLTLTASTVSTSAQLNTGGNVSVTGSINVSDDSTTRSNLGLGSMATQNANAVAITGGTINTVQPATGQSLTIKDEDGNTAITVGTDNTATGYLSLNFGSYHGGSGTLSGNTLDDYEEGTWTPTYTTADGTNEPSYTPDIIENQYTKIGRVVNVICFFRTDAVSSVGSGDLALGGLPFSTSNRSYLTVDYAIFGGSSQRPEFGFVDPGETKLIFTYASSAYSNTTRIATSNLINGSNKNIVAFSFSYLTNS